MHNLALVVALGCKMLLGQLLGQNLTLGQTVHPAAALDTDEAVGQDIVVEVCNTHYHPWGSSLTSF